jgi:hypothetical protein
VSQAASEVGDLNVSSAHRRRRILPPSTRASAGYRVASSAVRSAVSRW